MTATRHPAAMDRVRLAPQLAWVVVALTVGLAAPLMVIGAWRAGRHVDAVAQLVLFVLPLCGALVINQQPRSPLGWLMVVSGVADAAGRTMRDGRIEAFGHGPPIAAVDRRSTASWALGVPLLFALGLLLFPDGLPSARWRSIVASAILGVAVLAVAPMGGPLTVLGELLLVPGIVGGLVAGVVRYRRGDGVVRGQIRLLLGFAGLAVTALAVVRVMAVVASVPASVETALPGVVLAGYPVSVTLAIYRHRLFGLDVVINRAAVHAVCLVGMGALYAGVVVSFSWRLARDGHWLPSFLGAVVVGVTYPLLATRVDRILGRRLRGRADDPLDVLTSFDVEVRDEVDLDALLHALVRLVQSTLRLPYACIRLEDHTVIETGPQPRLPVHEVALASHGHHFGSLIVSARSPSDAFSERDRSLLAQLAHQMATEVRLVRLADDARRARDRIATSVIEERLRLRRDLHDEVGPRLAGAFYMIEALRGSVSSGDGSLVDDAAQQVQSVIAEVRRLAHDLRPAILEEIGLVDALRRQAGAVASGSALAVTVEAVGECVLPPIVETALYRVALEALNNVVRHADATRCEIGLRVEDDVVTMEIADDGCGIAPDAPTGLGLRSMRDRIDGLGGGCTFDVGGGTRVRIEVPLHG